MTKPHATSFKIQKSTQTDRQNLRKNVETNIKHMRKMSLKIWNPKSDVFMQNSPILFTINYEPFGNESSVKPIGNKQRWLSKMI